MKRLSLKRQGQPLQDQEAVLALSTGQYFELLTLNGAASDIKHQDQDNLPMDWKVVLQKDKKKASWGLITYKFSKIVSFFR